MKCEKNNVIKLVFNGKKSRKLLSYIITRSEVNMAPEFNFVTCLLYQRPSLLSFVVVVLLFYIPTGLVIFIH